MDRNGTHVLVTGGASFVIDAVKEIMDYTGHSGELAAYLESSLTER